MKFNISNDNAIRLVEAFGRALESKDVDLFYSAFTQHFNDRSDFETCLNNLNSEKSNIARLGYFYYVATKEIGHAGVVLIAIFSIMEATATEEFKPFDQWLITKSRDDENISYPIVSKKDFKRMILSFREEFFKEHGSSMKVRSFICKYFSHEDKQKLTSGFKIINQNSDYENIDQEKKVKVIVNMLYNERNAFVHNARLPQISDQNVKMLGSCKIRGGSVIFFV